jgi:predicted  nucleic acid-binding Zn-ribbon protein
MAKIRRINKKYFQQWHRHKTPCANQDCGNRLFEKTWDENGATVWECPNCGQTKPRRVLTYKPSTVERTIERLKERLLWEFRPLFGAVSEEAEYKEWEVKDGGRLKFVHATVGYKNDEGTGLRLCRKLYSVCIQANGRYTLDEY